MPKLQKQLSRKKGKKTYYKYVVTIPPELIEKMGVKEGDEVEIDLKKIFKDKETPESTRLRRIRKIKNSDN